MASGRCVSLPQKLTCWPRRQILCRPQGQPDVPPVSAGKRCSQRCRLSALQQGVWLCLTLCQRALANAPHLVSNFSTASV